MAYTFFAQNYEGISKHDTDPIFQTGSPTLVYILPQHSNFMRHNITWPSFSVKLFGTNTTSRLSQPCKVCCQKLEMHFVIIIKSNVAHTKIMKRVVCNGIGLFCFVDNILNCPLQSKWIWLNICKKAMPETKEKEGKEKKNAFWTP